MPGLEQRSVFLITSFFLTKLFHRFFLLSFSTLRRFFIVSSLLELLKESLFDESSLKNFDSFLDVVIHCNLKGWDFRRIVPSSGRLPSIT